VARLAVGQQLSDATGTLADQAGCEKLAIGVRASNMTPSVSTVPSVSKNADACRARFASTPFLTTKCWWNCFSRRDSRSLGPSVLINAVA
jgi:hypothetical protein